jgi:hypothetical protein
VIGGRQAPTHHSRKTGPGLSDLRLSWTLGEGSADGRGHN